MRRLCDYCATELSRCTPESCTVHTVPAPFHCPLRAETRQPACVSAHPLSLRDRHQHRLHTSAVRTDSDIRRRPRWTVCERMKRLSPARAKGTPEPGPPCGLRTLSIANKSAGPRESHDHPSNTFVQSHKNSDKSVSFATAAATPSPLATHAASRREPRRRPLGPEQYTLVLSSHQRKTYLSQQRRRRSPGAGPISHLADTSPTDAMIPTPALHWPRRRCTAMAPAAHR
jgi:hypothetical protein